MLEGYHITLRRALRLMNYYAEENPTYGQDMMVKVFHKSRGLNHKKTVGLYQKLRLPVVIKRRLRRLVEPVESLV